MGKLVYFIFQTSSVLIVDYSFGEFGFGELWSEFFLYLTIFGLEFEWDIPHIKSVPTSLEFMLLHFTLSALIVSL